MSLYRTNWRTLACFLRHGWGWAFIREGADGWTFSEGVNTWWCPRCRRERLSRLRPT